ncbi:hypothetical protein [Bacillus thuringiensis]|uniref:hypothetical protein n=1 Tax=Bacillus thuringiensis TaxID=1428 RepID=UPI000A366E75|nr:hypothetical protein [Bacillus thuringiensis]OTX59630.1 hypothetical protein BK723_03955 [Bacillus thuringiensis serovar pondicheriensis]
MKSTLNLTSLQFMVSVIVEDLENFRLTGNRLFDFEEVRNCTNLDELFKQWLLQFDDLSSTPDEDLEDVKLELSEHMKYISIWNVSEVERATNVKSFKDYFEGYEGFSKLVVDFYETSSKEDEEWAKTKNSPEFKAKFKELTGMEI